MTDSGAPALAPRVSASRAWAFLALLTAINIVCTMDRVLPQFIAEAIKEEFSLSDGQIGLLIGTAYGLPYGISGLLLGPVIDRVSRRKLLGAILTIWSAMTMWSAFATSFVTLLAARAGVGSSESATMPASLSMIPDIFRIDMRSTAIGLYKVSGPLGYFLCSVVVASVLPTYGWRATFLVAGAPGLVLALILIFGTRDPVRGGGAAGAMTIPVPFLTVLRFVMANRLITPTILGFLLFSMTGAGITAFAVICLQRVHGLSIGAAGYYLAMAAATGIIGPIILGYWSDRLTRHGMHRSFLFFVAAVVVMAAAAILFALAPTLWLAILALGVWYMISLGLSAPIYGAILTLTDPPMRGTVMSIFLVASLSIGASIGPALFGMLSDAIGGPNSVPSAIIIFSIIGYLPNAGFFLLSARNMPRPDPDTQR